MSSRGRKLSSLLASLIVAGLFLIMSSSTEAAELVCDWPSCAAVGCSYGTNWCWDLQCCDEGSLPCTEPEQIIECKCNTWECL